MGACEEGGKNAGLTWGAGAGGAWPGGGALCGGMEPITGGGTECGGGPAGITHK